MLFKDTKAYKNNQFDLFFKQRPNELNNFTKNVTLPVEYKPVLCHFVLQVSDSY